MAGIELSLDKAAQVFGCEPRTIHNWLRDGCPGHKVGTRWSMNSAEVSEWLRQRERLSALGEMSNVDEKESRRRKIAAEAGLAELELALKQGAAVAIAEFESQMTVMIMASRAKLLNLGTKLAPLLIGMPNIAEAKDVIDGGIIEALAELSRGEHVPDDRPRIDGPAERSGEGSEPVGAASGPERKRVGRRAAKAKPRKQR